MDLDWSNDNLHKLTVVFAYDYWENAGANLIAQKLPKSSNESVLFFQSIYDRPAAQAYFTNGQIVPTQD